jgi:carboxylate-amine ligase
VGATTAGDRPRQLTVGVEEEYHLVDPATAQLLTRPVLSEQAAQGRAGPHLQPEMLTSQLEAATDVCADLEQVRAAILGMRAEAARAAAAHGAVLLATSTHPVASLDQVAVAPRPRYQVLVERFGTIVDQFNLCGCHVHVRIPDLDIAVAVMDHARQYLPVLAALTGSSPFHEAVDTGCASIRLARLALWPQGGPPPVLHSADEYLALVAQLTATGMIGEPGELLWELRPSARFPTLEFRIGDVCPDIDDAVLHAGLVRSLVRTLIGRVAAGEPAPAVPDAVLAAARWRAARYGLTDRLWSVSRQALAPAAVVVEDFWHELEPDAARHGEDGVLGALLQQVMRRGTSASRQRSVLAETGSLQEVVRDGVRLTAAPAGARGEATTSPAPARG